MIRYQIKVDWVETTAKPLWELDCSNKSFKYKMLF